MMPLEIRSHATSFVHLLVTPVSRPALPIPQHKSFPVQLIRVFPGPFGHPCSTTQLCLPLERLRLSFGPMRPKQYRQKGFKALPIEILTSRHKPFPPSNHTKNHPIPANLAREDSLPFTSSTTFSFHKSFHFSRLRRSYSFSNFPSAVGGSSMVVRKSIRSLRLNVTSVAVASSNA